MMEQQQIEYDIYYQGSSTQLYALLYPLSGPNSSIFQHLTQQKVTYDINNKKLQFTYSPQNFENIDKQKEQIKYSSKTIPSQSNYFYSIFHQDTGSFVWRNVNNFLQMRPENRVNEKNKQDEKNKKTLKKPIVEENVQINVLQLQVVESGARDNLIQKEINNAPVSELKQTWRCSKQEYFSYLAH